MEMFLQSFSQSWKVRCYWVDYIKLHLNKVNLNDWERSNFQHGILQWRYFHLFCLWSKEGMSELIRSSSVHHHELIRPSSVQHELIRSSSASLALIGSSSAHHELIRSSSTHHELLRSSSVQHELIRSSSVHHESIRPSSVHHKLLRSSSVLYIMS